MQNAAAPVVEVDDHRHVLARRSLRTSTRKCPSASIAVLTCFYVLPSTLASNLTSYCCSPATSFLSWARPRGVGADAASVAASAPFAGADFFAAAPFAVATDLSKLEDAALRFDPIRLDQITPS